MRAKEIVTEFARKHLRGCYNVAASIMVHRVSKSQSVRKIRKLGVSSNLENNTSFSMRIDQF